MCIMHAKPHVYEYCAFKRNNARFRAPSTTDFLLLLLPHTGGSDHCGWLTCEMPRRGALHTSRKADLMYFATIAPEGNIWSSRGDDVRFPDRYPRPEQLYRVEVFRSILSGKERRLALHQNDAVFVSLL